jgi:hypothetical protein
MNVVPLPEADGRAFRVTWPRGSARASAEHARAADYCAPCMEQIGLRRPIGDGETIDHRFNARVVVLHRGNIGLWAATCDGCGCELTGEAAA